MYIWAFDPGSEASGVAFVTVDDFSYWGSEQFADPVDAWGYYKARAVPRDTVLVEMYRSGGYLTKHAQNTIEAVGFFQNAARYSGAAPLIVPEQARLSSQREAAELMEDTIEALVKDPERKDAFSALSHCCSYRRTLTT